MIITKETPGTPLWKLEREASRAMTILDRHGDKSPVLRSFNETLRPTALDFLAVKRDIYGADRRDSIELAEANASLSDAITLLRSWLGPLSRDVPGFELGRYSKLEVPEDVINAAQSLISFVQELQAAGKAPTYAEELVQTVTTALATLKTEMDEAQNALARAQELRARGRELGTQLHNELVAFRRVLRAVLGSSHRDYQRLRTNQISREDDEDAILEAIETDPEEPIAAPSATAEEVAAE